MMLFCSFEKLTPGFKQHPTKEYVDPDSDMS